MSIKLLKIALILFFISYNNTYSQDKEYHIVEKGETFYSISKKFNKSIEELDSLFKRCCTTSVSTLLHGILYRCPTSAHGTNLEAVPDKPEDIVNLGDDKLNLEETRKQLEDFYYNKKSITACYYCKGRDYAFGEIDAAIQTKRPLTIAKAN